MKKIYITPAVKVKEIMNPTILAGSETMEINEGSVGTGLSKDDVFNLMGDQYGYDMNEDSFFKNFFKMPW